MGLFSGLAEGGGSISDEGAIVKDIKINRMSRKIVHVGVSRSIDEIDIPE